MPRKKPTAKPAPAPAEPAEPASLLDMARAQPGLAIGGGLLIGLIAGALIPRGTARRLAQGAVAAAVVGSEVGLGLARQASESAREAAGEASEHLRSGAGRAGESARRIQRGKMAAAGTASIAGLDLARAALRFIAARKG
jgi:hypothetical protein